MIRVRRWLDSSKVREMCIRYDYYTCGDCESYERMLRNADNIETETEMQEVKQIAIDIFDHSALSKRGCDNYTAKDCIEGIMYGLLSECTELYVEMDDDEVGGYYEGMF